MLVSRSMDCIDTDSGDRGTGWTADRASLGEVINLAWIRHGASMTSEWILRCAGTQNRVTAEDGRGVYAELGLRHSRAQHGVLGGVSDGCRGLEGSRQRSLGASRTVSQYDNSNWSRPRCQTLVQSPTFSSRSINYGRDGSRGFSRCWTGAANPWLRKP